MTPTLLVPVLTLTLQRFWSPLSIAPYGPFREQGRCNTLADLRRSAGRVYSKLVLEFRLDGPRLGSLYAQVDNVECPRLWLHVLSEASAH